MLLLFTAIVTASLLGSTHCVGMCGPLAIWASGAGDRATRRQVIVSTILYHLGRLTTYTIVGLIAGGIGSLVDLGGYAFGYQLAAARIVGASMALIGVWKLARLIFASWAFADWRSTPSRMGRLLLTLRPYVFAMPPSLRAVSVGILTTLLPCGWLYLFALFAAGTGSMQMGGITMAAFWLGTVPALTALIAGTQTLSSEFVRVVPVVTAILMIIAGGFTASGRGFAGLNSMADIAGATIDLTSDGQIQMPAGFCDGGAVPVAPPDAWQSSENLINSHTELDPAN